MGGATSHAPWRGGERWTGGGEGAGERGRFRAGRGGAMLSGYPLTKFSIVVPSISLFPSPSSPLSPSSLPSMVSRTLTGSYRRSSSHDDIITGGGDFISGMYGHSISIPHSTNHVKANPQAGCNNDSITKLTFP